MPKSEAVVTPLLSEELVSGARSLHYAKHPVLQSVCQPVEGFDEELSSVLDDMQKMVDFHEAYGIAANQLGVELRVIRVHTRDGVWEMVNPEITDRSRASVVMKEGCLSLPGVQGHVSRSKNIAVAYLDREGGAHRMNASGITSVVIQHEIDHLDGILFIDHMTEKNRVKAMKDLPAEFR